MNLGLTGRYVDKKQALAVLSSIGVEWSQRQIDWTAEPDSEGRRKWPWFVDDKGILRIDEGFIRTQFQRKQEKALQHWKNDKYKL